MCGITSAKNLCCWVNRHFTHTEPVNQAYQDQAGAYNSKSHPVGRGGDERSGSHGPCRMAYIHDAGEYSQGAPSTRERDKSATRAEVEAVTVASPSPKIATSTANTR